MRTFASRYLLSIGAAAALAACSQAAPLVGAPRLMPQSHTSGAQADHAGSWVSPEAATSDLLYVGTLGKGLSMYTYPEGKLVGVVENANFSRLAGECIDASGDVFVTNLGNNEIFEYPHGSKKLAQTLDAPTGYNGIDCSVDPTTGNLAVSLLHGRGDRAGGVAIYPRAQGSPQLYTTPNIHGYFFCGYDDEGNLFIDGRPPTGTFHLAELPAGSSKFVDITLNEKIGVPGSVLWHGKYLAVGDQYAADVYEFRIRGSHGTLVNTTPLNGIKPHLADRAFWIQGKRIVVATRSKAYPQGAVDFFAYPAGGNATKIVSKDVRYPLGLTVSLAPR
jgi:hypothetical protein